jgi:hypothetical protein
MVKLLLFFVQQFRHQSLNEMSDKNSFVIVSGQLKSKTHPLIQSNELWGDLSDTVCCLEQIFKLHCWQCPKILHFPFCAL